QPALAYLALCLLDRIWDPVEDSKPPLEVEQQPCGTWVAVAGLANRARVQQPASVQLNAEPVWRDPADDLLAVEEERERDVAVSDQHERRVRELERRPRRLLREHVLPDRVACAGVEEIDTVQLRGRPQSLEESAG